MSNKDLQLSMQITNAAQIWVATIMQQYGVSAAVMENALSKALLILKDMVAQDLIDELTAETPVQEEGEINDAGASE